MATTTFDNPALRGGVPTAPQRGGAQASARRPGAGAASQALDYDFDDADDDSDAGPKARKIRVPKHEIANMTGQLAIMIKSGLDLSSALTSLVNQCERPALAAVLEDVNELVLSGNTFSQALKMHPEVFDGAYVATIAAAEASGRMAEVLKQLAAMQHSEVRLRGSIKGLATYPLLLTGISGGVIGILVVFVLPRFATIFQQYEVPLPVVTQALLAVAAEFRSRWWLWLPLVGGLLPAIAVWRSTDAGRRVIDATLLKGVVVRDVTKPLLVGRLCSMLGLLLESGVPLVEGLRLCRDAANNRLYKELLDEVEDSVVNGHGMGEVIGQSEIVPTSAREMLVTAERTGNLAEVAQLLGQYYEDEAETRMKQMVRIVEPLITVGMGLVVAVVVLSVMLPIFDLSTAGH